MNMHKETSRQFILNGHSNDIRIKTKTFNSGNSRVGESDFDLGISGVVEFHVEGDVFDAAVLTHLWSKHSDVGDARRVVTNCACLEVEVINAVQKE